MDTFPAFFPLAGARIVIAGEGPPAEIRARLLAGSPARVERLQGPAALDPSAYAGARLVFIASHDREFCEAAAAAARRGGPAPVNVVDRPDLSDFHVPAIVDRGAVVAAVGTAGAAPLLASQLRAELEARVPESAGVMAALLGQKRAALREAFPDLDARRTFLRAVLGGPVAHAAAEGDVEHARALLAEALAQAPEAGPRAVGRVSFLRLGAAPDLMSLRGARALARSDVVVAGEAAADLLASHGRREAERMAPEAANPAVLADLARRGRLVVVIEADGAGSGAPEAAEILRGLGVEVEVIGPASAA